MAAKKARGKKNASTTNQKRARSLRRQELGTAHAAAADQVPGLRSRNPKTRAAALRESNRSADAAAKGFAGSSES